MQEVVKMSPKGQLVVPQDIRKSCNFEPGERFAAYPIKDGVIFRKVEINRSSFEDIARDVQKQFNKNKVAPETVGEAVKWSRKL